MRAEHSRYFTESGVRQQKGGGLGQGRVLGKTPFKTTQLHQAVGATWALSLRAGNLPLCASVSSYLKWGV